MIGITLSADQVRTAPPDVRRWLQQELGTALGLVALDHPDPEALANRLVGCNPDEAAAMLELVQGMLPVVNVFFELGREAISAPVHGLRAFRLTDLARNTRLSTPEQVLECLDVLTTALRRVRGDAEALFYLVDGQGHCLIAEPTMRGILHVWQEIVARRQLQMPAEAPHEAPAVAA